ncbi:LOW QUALITY PROTEIN: hypothetical protein ACHAXT_007800 [Thalassiosira profunda]
MGGDDLGSDDEYLFDAGLVGAGGGKGTAVSSDEDGSVGSGDSQDVQSSSGNRKRKGTSGPDAGVDKRTNGVVKGDAGQLQLQPSSSKKKRRKEKAPTNAKNVLIHAGRGIAMDGPDAQAAFPGDDIRASHETGAAGGDDAAKNTGEATDGKLQTAASNGFDFGPHLYANPSASDEKALQFQHNNLAAFLKGGLLPSTKRLKNWKHPHSPMVLVITLSARRSVELMKQLSSLKLPVAKLFAKHMSVEDQVELLKGVGSNKPGKKGRYYSLAVGTPGRLLKLLRHGRDEPGSDGLGALRLNRTEVIIIDCHEDSKGWTVCTLNDTARELMGLMQEGVVPQLGRRKGKAKVALF